MNITDRQKKRTQIESNDPDLTNLTISKYNYLPHDGDWERDGQGIGENEHIKDLYFGNDLGAVGNRDDFEAFCAGLASNKSIERLTVCCDLFGGEISTMLSPFFEQNSNLRSLVIYAGFRGVRFLSDSLSRFNTLREFECITNELLDNEVETLIRAFSGHSRLAKIDLHSNKLGEGRALLAELAALLKSPNSSLEDLNLSHCSIDEGTSIFADALGGNNTLKKLNVSKNSNISTAGWSAIFTQLQSPRSLLEDLDLSGNSINDAAVILLGNTLSNNTHLKVLNLSAIMSITSEGWQYVFDALQGPRCILQELDLHNNNIRDEHVDYLTSSLSNNCVLRCLNLHTNENVTTEGWSAFSAILQNPNSALEKIDLAHNSISDDAVVSFANSLRHNSKLKELFIEGFWGFEAGDEDDYEVDEGTPITNWDALSNVLCNVSSINETFSSNHTFHRVVDPDSDYADESQLPADLQTLLQLNRENYPTEAARRKILKVHFSGAFNMQPFIDMDLKAVPYAIAWMARDEYGSSLLYQFVRNTTFFVGLAVVQQT